MANLVTAYSLAYCSSSCFFEILPSAWRSMLVHSSFSIRFPFHGAGVQAHGMTTSQEQARPSQACEKEDGRDVSEGRT